MAIELTSDIINDLVNKGYVHDTSTQRTYLHKRYSAALDVSIVHSSYKPDQINLNCVFDINGLINNFSLTTFPLSEIQKQLTEIFGSCGFYRTIHDNFRIIFYIQEEEKLLQWVDTLEEDADEFISLVVDLITDMLEEKEKE